MKPHSLMLILLFAGLFAGSCKNREAQNSSTVQAPKVEDRIPGFFQVVQEISEVRIEQNGQQTVLKINAAMRPQEFNGLVKGIRNAAVTGELASSFTHRMDFRHPAGGVFADYDLGTNCLHFKDQGPLEAGGAVVWPAAGFAEAMKGCAAFWEGYPEE